MATGSPRLRLLLLAGIMAAGGLCAPAFAQTAADATQEEREACQPDVLRICPNMVIGLPNVPAIVICLRENRPSLSPACERVMFPPQRGRAPARR